MHFKLGTLTVSTVFLQSGTTLNLSPLWTYLSAIDNNHTMCAHARFFAELTHTHTRIHAHINTHSPARARAPRIQNGDLCEELFD